MLSDLAPETIAVAVPEEAVMAIGSGSPSFRGRYGLDPNLPWPEGFMAEITGALDSLPDGAFAKMGLFSFKAPDRRAAHTRVTQVSDLEAMLRPGPPRLIASLMEMMEADLEVFLHLAPWLDIPPWTEFRLFVQNGRVGGVSQYHVDRVFPEIADHAEEIAGAIEALLPHAIGDLPLADCALDLAVAPGAGGTWTAWVIEVNPLGPHTLMGLFKRSEPFDGSFRFRMVGA